MTDNVTQINSDAFYNCVNLKDIELSENLVKIGYNAFRQCYALEGINIPSSVSFIGRYAFYESGLKSATLSSEKNWVIQSFVWYFCAICWL